MAGSPAPVHEDTASEDGREMGDLVGVPESSAYPSQCTSFPSLFSSNASLGLPYIPIDSDQAPVKNNASITLKGVLCFFMPANLSTHSNCINIYNQTAAWLDKPMANADNHSTNATWLSGWWPSMEPKGNSTLPPQP